MHYDVSEVVGGAESFLNWRAKLRKWPWLAVGLSALAGYFVIPRKPTVVQEVVAQPRRFAAWSPAPPPPPPKPKSSLAGAAISGAWGLLGPVALGIGRNYLIGLAENLLNGNRLHEAESRDAASL